uniref:LOW QUALITY PROTEIN: solute carrier family 45 member 4-like n=1 Tax=Petromyzon marinus TaxID=7757 RepID=A0AAJ7T183_PETMA
MEEALLDGASNRKHRRNPEPPAGVNRNSRNNNHGGGGGGDEARGNGRVQDGAARSPSEGDATMALLGRGGGGGGDEAEKAVEPWPGKESGSGVAAVPGGDGDESESDSDSSVEELPLRQWVMNGAITFGREFCYAVDTALVTPVLLTIGLPEQYYSLTWFLSPVLGLIFTPLIGSASDRCTLRWGRRRPFILVLSIGTLIGIMLFLNGANIGLAVGDVPGEQLVGIVVTVLGVVLLDFCADAADGPVHAYLLDNADTEEQDRALSIHSLAGSLGGALGYMMGGIDWTHTPLGLAFRSQQQVLFFFTSLVFTASLLLHLFSIPEEVYTGPVSDEGSSRAINSARANSSLQPNLEEGEGAATDAADAAAASSSRDPECGLDDRDLDDESGGPAGDGGRSQALSCLFADEVRSNHEVYMGRDDDDDVHEAELLRSQSDSVLHMGDVGSELLYLGCMEPSEFDGPFMTPAHATAEAARSNDSLAGAAEDREGSDAPFLLPPLDDAGAGGELLGVAADGGVGDGRRLANGTKAKGRPQQQHGVGLRPRSASMRRRHQQFYQRQATYDFYAYSGRLGSHRYRHRRANAFLLIKASRSLNDLYELQRRQRMRMQQRTRLRHASSATEESEGSESSDEVEMEMSVRLLWLSMFKMPRQLLRLCLCHLITWVSIIAMSVFYTDFMGQVVFQGEPTAPHNSTELENYNKGVQYGCWGLVIYAATAALLSGLLQRYTVHRDVSLKLLYSVGTLGFSLGMAVMAAVPNLAVSMTMIGTMGLLYVVLSYCPYAMLGFYHEDDEYVRHSPGGTRRGLGIDCAILSCQVYISQILVAAGISVVIDAFDTVRSVPVVASAAAFLAFLAATFILIYPDDDDEEEEKEKEEGKEGRAQDGTGGGKGGGGGCAQEERRRRAPATLQLRRKPGKGVEVEVEEAAAVVAPTPSAAALQLET